MRFGSKREAKHTKIEIIPMIDTMFFLLVFFVLASLNIIDLRGLNLDLPPAAMGKPTAKTPEDVKLEIEIDKDGNQTLNGGPGQPPIKLAKGVSSSGDLLKLIDGQLGRHAGATDVEKITVIISPDPETQHENVIHAVDDSRGARLEKFSIR